MTSPTATRQFFRRSGAKRTRRRDQPDALRDGLLEHPVSDEGVDNDVLIDKGEQGDSDVPEIIGEDLEVERERLEQKIGRAAHGSAWLPIDNVSVD
jgi:hypothetical protein